MNASKSLLLFVTIWTYDLEYTMSMEPSSRTPVVSSVEISPKRPQYRLGDNLEILCTFSNISSHPILFLPWPGDSSWLEMRNAAQKPLKRFYLSKIEYATEAGDEDFVLLLPDHSLTITVNGRITSAEIKPYGAEKVQGLFLELGRRDNWDVALPLSTLEAYSLYSVYQYPIWVHVNMKHPAAHPEIYRGTTISPPVRLSISLGADAEPEIKTPYK